jgi:hypothetical protein
MAIFSQNQLTSQHKSQHPAGMHSAPLPLTENSRKRRFWVYFVDFLEIICNILGRNHVLLYGIIR